MAISGTRVGSGTCASSAWRTIGASVPSTSRSTALRDGSARSGASASASARFGDGSPTARGTAVVWRSMAAGRTLKLAAIGTAAGVFSGLFGVGGGTVIVPLLILWLRYGEREATGTSLAAIVVVAAVAAATQAAYGNVRFAEGALVGIPAIGGVVAGTWLQQRVPARAVSLLFAALLLITAG